MSIKKSINSTVLLALKMIGVASSALLVVFLQKITGTEMQGYYALLFNLTHVATIFCVFGMPALITRQISEILALFPNAASERIDAAFSICLQSMLVVFLVAAPLLVIVFIYFGLNTYEAIVSLPIVFLNILVYLFGYYIRGFKLFRWMIFITESSRLFLSLAFILVVYVTGDVSRSSILYSVLFASAISCFIGYVVAKKYAQLNLTIRYFRLGDIRQCLKSSFPLMLSSFTMLCMQQSNVIQVSLYSTLYETGVFNFANKLMAFSVMPLSIIGAIYGQKASEVFICSGAKESKKLLIRVSLLSLASSIIALIGINSLAVFVYDYADQPFDYKLLLICSMSYIFFSLYGFGISFLDMTNMAKSSAYIMMSTLAINFIVNYLLTPSLGAIGAAVSDAISHGMALIMLVLFMTFKFDKL